ncbi:DpnI domain-containing protein [Spirosoma sp.]|uniref:DpnI domain-containing protein n=1 Tax=Spirosoma sp. TaxID=1899569 RepID=UPI00261D2683|nr:DpnI domain-containing protein [Spirosoma sp.]MCX6214302.1 restriction endonuclease [Spirosoma sp.]
MNLKFDVSFSTGYTSSSQIARVLTESWVKQNAFCPSCGNDELNQFNNNSPVADFLCTTCKSEYELKSKKDSFSKRIVDGAYSTMIERINSENNPHFFFLNYSSKTFEVSNFLVIPKHYFIDNIIEKRKPLSLTARRSGWIGCNILLHSIPNSGKIFFIKNGELINKKIVIETWSKTSFLANQKKESRGWTIEVLKIIDKIPSKEFNLADIYMLEDSFKEKFPNNNFIKDKIRQQLQVLRDKGLLQFKGNGRYKKLSD